MAAAKGGRERERRIMVAVSRITEIIEDMPAAEGIVALQSVLAALAAVSSE